GRVADVEPDGWVECGEVHEVGTDEVARLARWDRAPGLGFELGNRTPRRDPKRLATLPVDRSALEEHPRSGDLRRSSGTVSSEDETLALIEPGVGKLESVLSRLAQRVFEKPLDQRVELAVLLEDIEDVVVPPVFTDQPVPARGGGGELPRR